ncbi:MAG TPA: glycosyltransferase family 1 protein [Ktedonobacterales bacterium]|nr:glycosyltransferase family 1 protein [Ktedonobacterales bacterium]
MIHVAINAQLVTFGQTYRNAGVSRYTYTLLEALDRLADDELRYTVFVGSAEAAAAAASPLSHSPRLRLEPARWPTDKPVKRIVWEQTRLPARLREAHADVFHAPVNVLPEWMPCPAVVTIHDLAFVRYPEYFRPARRLYQRTFTERSARAATLIGADSESTRQDIISTFGIAPERVRTIYPTISPEFQPIRDPAMLAAFRAKHKLPEQYLLYLGTLEPRKNVLTLVEAYARLRSEITETPPLILAGAKGWYYDALFERVRALGLERDVTFAGYVSREEQALWYAGAALFLYPSLYEGFGLPVAEALACGTPTITSNVSSLPEVGGPVAMQVAPTDADALAYAMRVALSDPGLRARMLVEGPAWTRQFSMERLARQYALVYREAAQRPR